MARHLSEREIRRIERQRRKEEEVERKLLEELDRELKEKHEHAVRDLKAQQEKIRKEKREKLERRKQILEKEKQLEEMEEQKRLMEERLLITDENVESNDMQGTMPQNMVYDDGHVQEDLIDESSEESDDSLYTTLDESEEENTETFIDMGIPKDASSFIDSRQDKLRTIEREMRWLDHKEREHQQVYAELERNSDLTEYKQTDEHAERSFRHLELSGYKVSKNKQTGQVKDRSYDVVMKREDTAYEEDMVENRELDYDESGDEERKLKEKIEQLQIKRRNVDVKIERNQLLKDMRRKEIERKRHEELKLRKEMQRRKEEKLRKLKIEKERLESEIQTKETTLNRLQEEDEIEKQKNKEFEQKKVKTVKTVKEKEYYSGKLLKPTVPSLTETTFEEWKIEVEVILKSGLYEESLLRQAVRNSLCGQTRKILLTIPPPTTTREIIDKLESVYGNVRSGESVLAEFYMARQRRGEGIAEWGIRLESIVQTAIEKGHIKDSQKDEMLKTRFWRQLYSEELKNATRMYFETAGTFEELRRKVRIEENEIRSAREEPTNDEKSNAIKGQTDKNEQETLLQDLVQRMDQLETEISKTRETDYDNRSGYRNEHRTDREYNRKDDEYNRERRYYGRDRIGGDRYYRDYGRDRRSEDRYNRDFRSDRREEGRYNRDYGINRRSDDRYNIDNRSESREEGRHYRDYGANRRNDDRYNEYKERRRYSPRDRRNDRKDYLDKEKEQRYYRDNRTSSHRDSRDRWEQGEKTEYKGSKDSGGQAPNREEKRSNRTDETVRDDRHRNQDREQRKYDNQDSKSSLNSKASLSEGR